MVRDELDIFLEVAPVDPPSHLTERILTQVKKDLNPSAWLVFSKIAFIHVFVGFFSLLMCPQFGLSPLGNMGLMHFLIKFGDAVCMLGCGAVFIGGTALVSSLVLKPEEIKILRQTRILQFGVLGILSVGAFLCVGAQIVLGLAAIWLLGSMVGGLLTLELGWIMRKRIQWT